MNCCVIDDEPLAAQLIASYIEKTPFLSLGGIFHSAQEAVRQVLNGDFDLMFLDINMPQLNGMEFARLVPDTTRIIFITAYDSHAIEAFRVGAADYLLKPVSYEEFASAVTRVHQRMAAHQPKTSHTAAPNSHLLIKSNHKYEQIDVNEIIHIEGLKDYVKIYMRGNRSVVTLSSMRALEEYLPPQKFMRVHRSYIVNTGGIISIERNRLTMINGTSIPISDGYRQAVADYVASHNV